MAKTQEEIKALRKEATDYMWKMSQLKWSPSEDLDLTRINKKLFYKKGETYYGIIYNTTTWANLEQFKEHLDENNVYIGTTDDQKIPGNHCTSSILLSWKHIGDQTTAGWSKNMLPTCGTGIYAVGDYVFDKEDDVTKKITAKNSAEVMYENYAKLQPADAVLTVWEKTGHARMIHEMNVVRDENGKVDPEKSYISTVEQTWSFDTEATVNTTWYIHRHYTFATLYEKDYIPITVKSFIE